METSVAAPLPIFRSDAQFAILGALYTHPGRELSISDLSGTVGHPLATVSRETSRLVEAELLRGRQEGRRHLVSANADHPIHDILRDLLLATYGPVSTLRRELSSLAGVDRALVFGSYAARISGEPGPAPRDVDILVLGDVAVTEVWDLTARLSTELGIEVNAVVRTPDEWAADATGFAERIRTGHQVPLVGT